MTAKEAAVWKLPNAFGCELVGWDGWDAWQGGPPPGPTGHTRILYGPHLFLDDLLPGEWLRLAGGSEAFADACGPEDIVSIPLLLSATNTPAWGWEKCPDYDAHLALIREIAPRVAGVMLGNMGPEFVGQHGGGVRFRRNVALLLAERFAHIVTEAGGTPYFGTVDWTLLMDCLFGGMLRDLMGVLGAVQVCFCGYTLSPQCFYDRDNRLYARQAAWQIKYFGEAAGRRLREYIASVPMWSDLNWFDGFHAGNDKECNRLGFVRGCL